MQSVGGTTKRIMVFLKKAYSSLFFGQVVLTFYLRVSPLACLNHLMTLLEDNLPWLLPIGQICLRGYMPRMKINSSALHWTGFFSSPSFKSLLLFSIGKLLCGVNVFFNGNRS